VVLAIGTRLADFTTGSWSLFKDPDRRIIGLNVQGLRRDKSTVPCRSSPTPARALPA